MIGFLPERTPRPGYITSTYATGDDWIIFGPPTTATAAQFEYVYEPAPETETERLLHEFRVEMQRWLATYQLWAALSRSERRAAHLSRRLRSAFELRPRRPRRARCCSTSTRWMANP